MEEQKKGFTKENIRKLMSWDKKDWFWLVFFILLLISVYAFYHDLNQMKKMRNSPCFQQCIMSQAVEQFKRKNPHIQVVDCNYVLGTCTLAGVFEPVNISALRNFNISLKEV